MTRGRRLSTEDLQRAVDDYGRVLVPLPPESLENLDVVQVRDADPSTFSVVIDLWTREEGRSDLTLELELVDRFNGAYDMSIQICTCCKGRCCRRGIRSGSLGDQVPVDESPHGLRAIPG